MTIKERVELQEAKIRLQRVGDGLCAKGYSLIPKDICKVIHYIEQILDDDLYGRHERREKDG